MNVERLMQLPRLSNMKLNRKTWMQACRILYIIIGVTGLLLHSGYFSGNLRTNMFIYYTNLSNLLCILLFAVLTIRTAMGRSNKKLQSFKGMCTLAILVTFLIYHFILRPLILRDPSSLSGAAAELGNVWTPNNILVHYILPLATLLDWLVFDEKGAYRWPDLLKWIAAPAGYCLFALVRAPLGGVIQGTQSRYPYPFLDVDLLGWPTALLNITVLLICFMVLACLYLGLDVLLGRLKPIRD